MSVLLDVGSLVLRCILDGGGTHVSIHDALMIDVLNDDYVGDQCLFRAVGIGDQRVSSFV